MSLVARQQSRLLCLLCQRQSRAFSTSYRQLAQKPENETAKTSSQRIADTAPTSGNGSPATPWQDGIVAGVMRKPPSPLASAPRSYGKRVEKFTPTPLSRPIGLPYPPEPGQNTGIDTRTLKQRRDDFVDYDKHLQKRKYLVNKISRPYFRDWTNMEFHKGKTFIAPPGIFKSELSLYFPNLYGRTAVRRDSAPRDTTPALRGRVSVVSVFSSLWAENQCKTFVSEEHHPALLRVIAGSGGLAQHVQVNVEDNALKALLVKLSMGRIRKSLGAEGNHGKYFLVRRGISDEIRENIGLLNSRVGYTYLVDPECKIRWAGSGNSEEHERAGLLKAVNRLLVDMREKKKEG
ncbi:ATP10 protein-domain-containing protein [Xylariaceae sp. FL0594]|nr:ATP10 protein-domain-containing protein [Xylariaceae sp. FL0594]